MRSRPANGSSRRCATGGCVVDVLPALGPGTDDAPGGFLPAGTGVSYLVALRGVGYLVLGDSVALPEHEGLCPDVAFFAVGGLVTQSPAAAARDAARVGAKVSVPVHWGDVTARHAAARTFVEECAAAGLNARAG